MFLKSINIDLRMVLPPFVAAITHWIIAAQLGFSKAGEVAFVMAWVAIISTVLSLKGDVKILIQSDGDLAKDFKVVSILILFFSLAGWFFTELNLFSNHFDLYIFSATLLAFSELFLSYLIRKKMVWFYVLGRVMPYFFVLAVALSWREINALNLWLIFSIVNFGISLFLIKNDIHHIYTNAEINRKYFWHYFFDGILPTLASLLGTLASNLLVISMTYKFGNEIVGVWANIYRLIGMPLFYLISINQYGVLVDMINHSLNKSKLLIAFLNMHRLIKYIIIYAIVVLIFGFFFTLFFQASLNSYLILLIALIFGVYRALTQYIESVSQSVSKSYYAVLIYFIEIIIVISYAGIFSGSYIYFLIFFGLTILIAIVLLNYYFYRYFFKVNI